MKFQDYLKNLGIKPGSNLLIHIGFKKLKAAFPGIIIESVINSLEKLVTETGSIIVPSFTYCFKKISGDYEIFDRETSPSKVGAFSEAFRRSKDVIRTSSATHSFLLWGQVKKYFDFTNSPISPLGKVSVLEWIANINNSFILTLGTDFSSMTFCHYLEIITPVPWANYAPWDFMNVVNIGVSVSGEQHLIEIPGCSKSFINFEKYLIQNGKINPSRYGVLKSYLIPVSLLMDEGIKFFKTHWELLLCKKGSCSFCDARRKRYL